MKRLLLTFAFCLLSFGITPKTFGISTGGAVFELDDKIKLVDWLKQHITEMLSNSIAEDKFIVNITLDFDRTELNREVRNLEARAQRIKSEIERKVASNDISIEKDPAVLYLDKLGVWAQTIENPKAEKSLAQSEYFTPEIIEKNLKVNVFLTLDTSLPQIMEENLLQILNDNIPLISKDNLSVSVKRMKLYSRVEEEKRKKQLEEEAKQEDKKMVKDENGELVAVEEVSPMEKFLLQVQKFQLTIATSFGLLALFVMLMLLVRRWSTLEQAKLSFDKEKHASSERRYSDEKRARESMDQVEEVSSTEDEKALGDKGYEEFLKLCEKDIEQATMFVKNLISTDSEYSKAALAGISRNTDIEKITLITEKLDLEERKLWSRQISDISSSSLINRGGRYLLNEFVDATILPSVEMEQEEKLALTGVSVEEFLYCATKDTSYAAVLVNILPTVQVGRALSQLDVDKAKEVSKMAVQLSGQEMTELTREVKRAVLEFRSSREAPAPPFVDKSIELIAESGPAREGMYFDTLAASGHKSYLSKAASLHFPAELVEKLPGDFLKDVVDSFALSQRAEIIYACDASLKSVLLESFGEGTKLRELIDVEIQFIEEDEERKTKIEASKDKVIWKFVKAIRTKLPQNPVAFLESEKIIEEWISNKMLAAGASHGRDKIKAA